MNAAPLSLAVAVVGLVMGEGKGEMFSGENMNGAYLLAPTPNGSATKWSTNFKDYPGGVESFEFYAVC